MTPSPCVFCEFSENALCRFALIMVGKKGSQTESKPPGAGANWTDAADIDAIIAVGELGMKVLPQKALIDIIAVDHLGKPTEN
jgi:uncharacterized protein (TIGR03435 family)